MNEIYYKNNKDIYNIQTKNAEYEIKQLINELENKLQIVEDECLCVEICTEIKYLKKQLYYIKNNKLKN